MIRHIVLLTFVNDATDAQVQAIADALTAGPGRLAIAGRYLVGTDIGVNPANAGFAVTADFATVDDYLAYRDDPEHQRIIAELITPILAGRAAVQYEI